MYMDRAMAVEVEAIKDVMEGGIVRSAVSWQKAMDELAVWIAGDVKTLDDEPIDLMMDMDDDELSELTADQAAESTLRACGCEERGGYDRSGVKRWGWWQDDVWLSSSDRPQWCLDALNG